MVVGRVNPIQDILYVPCGRCVPICKVSYMHHTVGYGEGGGVTPIYGFQTPKSEPFQSQTGYLFDLVRSQIGYS